MSEQQDGRRSIMEWFSELFSGEPSDRLELRETLRDAADALVTPGSVVASFFNSAPWMKWKIV